MAQLSANIPDELFAWLRDRVRYEFTITDQVIEALEEYRKHGTKKDRESEQVKAAQGRP